MGFIDAEEPPIRVVSVEDDTNGQEVLGLTVDYQVQGDVGRQRSESTRFIWDEWEDYTDKSPANMGGALALLVATELRESVNSVPREQLSSE